MQQVNVHLHADKDDTTAAARSVASDEAVMLTIKTDVFGSAQTSSEVNVFWHLEDPDPVRRAQLADGAIEALENLQAAAGKAAQLVREIEGDRRAERDSANQQY
jgi:hypothetical protein